MSHNVKLSLIKPHKIEVCCGIGIHIKRWERGRTAARACAALQCARVEFLAIKRAFFVCRVNCHLIIVSSCRRLRPAAIKTPFEAVIKNDIKFNLQRWRRAGLTVIGNVMSTFTSNVKIVFFVQIKLRFLLLNVVGAALSLYEYLVPLVYVMN